MCFCERGIFEMFAVGEETPQIFYEYSMQKV